MPNDQSLRDHLAELLQARQAHATLDAALKDFPPEQRGVKPAGLPYTAWQILEHIRIAQWDILEFSRNPDHVSPKWTEGYWPETDAPPDDDAWKSSVAAVQSDLEQMKELVLDPKTDLYAPIEWGDGQTILREAMLVADHNSYHVGQLVLIRRLLGSW